MDLLTRLSDHPISLVPISSHKSSKKLPSFVRPAESTKAVNNTPAHDHKTRAHNTIPRPLRPPPAHFVHQVKRSMKAIKVVVGERQRAKRAVIRERQLAARREKREAALAEAEAAAAAESEGEMDGQQSRRSSSDGD